MPELCLPQVRVLKGINTYGMERYIYIGARHHRVLFLCPGGAITVPPLEGVGWVGGGQRGNGARGWGGWAPAPPQPGSRQVGGENAQTFLQAWLTAQRMNHTQTPTSLGAGSTTQNLREPENTLSGKPRISTFARGGIVFPNPAVAFFYQSGTFAHRGA